MSDQIVEVIISPDGESQTVDVVGARGSGCKAIAALFDTGGTSKSTVKPEFYDGGGGSPTSVSVGR